MRVRNASDHSVHGTGMAVDLRSALIPARCRTWLRKTLESLEKAGVIEATEEKKVPHFHVAVFPSPYSNYVAQLSSTEAVVAEADDSGPTDDSAEPGVVSYLVRSGDSLWRIATTHDTSVQVLQDINKLRGSTIHPGQVILVPVANSPRSH
jgi:LysM repeat protein